MRWTFDDGVRQQAVVSIQTRRSHKRTRNTVVPVSTTQGHLKTTRRSLIQDAMKRCTAVGMLVQMTGYLAVATSISCPTYSQTECAGHGRCVRFNQTSNLCVCEEGHAGDDCAVRLACDPAGSRLPCSGHGTCGFYGCECAPGYAGELCQEDMLCPRNLVGLGCSGEVCSHALSTMI